MGSILAVAAHTFDKVSETFIRNHAENILPGCTSLIALDPLAVFLKTTDESCSFRASAVSKFYWGKIDSFLKLVIGKSVFYCGHENSNQLTKFLVNNGVKVMLAEYGPVGCAIARACKQANVKLYVHFHGYDASRLIEKMHIRYAYRELAKNSAGFIFPSKFLANQLGSIGIDNSMLYVAPCCVDTREFSFTTEKDNLLLLSIGRFVPKKAPHKTILAFAKILRGFPDLRLEMIGDGELLPMCKDLVQSLGIQKNVVFHGSQPHSFVKDRLSRAKLFLQHSVTAPDGDTEGLGVSLLEAMATGAVVVATRHNGFVETVVEGVTGFLVDENDVDAMTENVLILLRNEKLLCEMRLNARRRVENFYSVELQIATLKKIMGL